MDSSTTLQHHHQELNCSQTLESMLVCTKPQQEKKPRPTEQALNCPRCDSINTKFCYYNNYSLSQPRYFCKSCRRYWTKGGTLRNVPVGGGCRKNNKRPSSSSSTNSSSSSLSSKKIQDQPMAVPILNTNILPSNLNPLSFHDSNDLNLSILGNPNMPHSDHHHLLGSSGLINTSSGLFDSLRGGFLETPLGFHQNLYYGMGNENMGLENFGIGMSGSSQEMGMQYDQDYGGTTPAGPATIASTAVTTVKQEMRSNINARENDEGRVLWGFPWQNLGRNEEFDSSKLSWNGINNGPSNWHGLLNSPLM